MRIYQEEQLTNNPQYTEYKLSRIGIEPEQHDCLKIQLFRQGKKELEREYTFDYINNSFKIQIQTKGKKLKNET